MSQRINLNTTPNQFMPILYFSQGDIGRTFEVALTSSDGYSIPIGATVEMVATKPSGFGFTVSGSLTGNVATFVTTETMTSEWGRFPAEIVIKNNGDVIGTANFYLNGERNPHPEGTIDGDASTIIPQLTLLVERVETAASSVLDRQTVTQTLPAGSQASYSFDEETNTQTFGIPQGEAGAGAVDVTASAYSSSKTYAVGDYVIHNDYLYRCTTAITTAEAWTSGHWTQVLLGGEVSDVKSALSYYTAVDKHNYLNERDFVSGYIVIGGAIQAYAGHGYVAVNVTNGTKYVSNIQIRVVAGTDKEAIVQRVDEWTATYTGIAYFSFQTTLVDANSYLVVDGTDADLVGTYQHRALASDIMAQSLGISKKITMSQNAILDSISSEIEITFESGKYMSNATSGIRTGADHSVSNVFFLKKGQRVFFTANGYGNMEVSIFAETDSSGQTLIDSILTSTGNVYQSVDYIATHDMYVRISKYTSSTSPTVKATSASGSYEPKTRTNILEVGTGKQFTSLVDAVEFITDSSELNQYIIHLYEGTYNTVVTADITTGYLGLVLPPYVSIVGIGSRDSIIIYGEVPSGYETYAKDISTLNFRSGGLIKNVTIKGKNINYLNHDDWKTMHAERVTNIYENVLFYMDTISADFDVSGACVGIGAQWNKTVKFIRCDFYNANSNTSNRVGIVLHDSNGENGIVFEADSCKFSGGMYAMNVRTVDHVLQNWMTLKGNKFANNILFRSDSGINAFNIRAWGNKGFGYTLVGISDISADLDAYANEA